VLVLGINTGTSVDGVDMALVKWNLDNLKDFKIIKESSYKFDPGVKKDIDILIALQKASLEDLSNLNFKYSQFIAALVSDFISELSADGFHSEIDLIGLHGQTVFHGSKSTLQLGNASVLATISGIPSIADFRSADIAVGGCGAPLTSFIDEKLVRSPTESVATLNLGGIANISVMQVGKPTIAFDTGPGNTLIDSLTEKLFHKPYDLNGAIAYQGRVNEDFIEAMYFKTEYFKLPPPKSTGRELFDEKYADKFLDLGNKENIIATVSHFTVTTITRELKKYPITKVFLSGGGVNNCFIMEHLKIANPRISFLDHSDFGIKSQYKEAILFSLLAFTSFHGIPNNVPSSTGARREVVLGTLANPGTSLKAVRCQV
jgi:anhydro-N-acetylmuramic acid kinase